MPARRPPAPRTRASAGSGTGTATTSRTPPARTTPPRASTTRSGSAGRGRGSGSARSSTRSTPSQAPDRPRGKPGPTSSTARRGSRGSAAREEVDEPRQITVRGLVLFVVILMAFIVLAPTLRAYVSVQEESRDLAAQIAATQERNAQLQAQIDQWNDPVYIQSQARDRLGFVMPGETPYRVVDPETVTGEEPAGADDQGPVSVPPTGPWYLTVWDSVQVAGEVED
ncbi:FtsB family cell division protein [Ruania rhizosphaerae]|uniref:FtsB family cell division protein n=1 Tax=Ruania rhizosphaerae TaxID=1840413 RepID=UPI0023B29C2C|nr:septum formation initiator family protein [Ruania rhizosphaerae]